MVLLFICSYSSTSVLESFPDAMAHDLRGFPKTTLQLPEFSSQWLLLSNSLVHQGGANLAMAQIAQQT